MPVTVIPASHQPKRHPELERVQSLDQFLRLSCADSYIKNETSIVASSFSPGSLDEGNLYPSPSSFLRSAVEAWGRHSHLVLRPEEVWFTILVQMNFYMETAADSLWHIFAADNKRTKQNVHVEADSYGAVVAAFRSALQARITAPWVADWISPGFSTSTVDDERTATVLMMGLMKQYFSYSGAIICGIPSVTLLGVREDWERLLAKIDRMGEFGDQPEDYARRLRPLLTRMVRTFDDPSGTETRNFWNGIVQARHEPDNMCGAPPRNYIVSGWILGFFYWANIGVVSPTFSKGLDGWGPGQLEYDGVVYGAARLEDIPVGYAKARFSMKETHPPVNGWLLAGNVGKNIVHGAPEGYQAALAALGRPKEGIPLTEGSEDEHSTIQPMSGWFLFSPDKDNGPVSRDTAEMSGPTVDAIRVCVPDYDPFSFEEEEEYGEEEDPSFNESLTEVARS